MLLSANTQPLFELLERIIGKPVQQTYRANDRKGLHKGHINAHRLSDFVHHCRAEKQEKQSAKESAASETLE